jgi:glycosyltransferase involved in cell wall biosynthesis
MSNNPLVSVIIPVYNAQEFLGQCIDSVLASELADIEIILVDDGSVDDSNSICKNYLERDARIKLIEQENTGAWATRNAGIMEATGKYLHFLDADDYIVPSLYNDATALCEKHDLDFCVFHSRSLDITNDEFRFNDWSIKEHLRPEKKIFCYMDVEKDVFSLFTYAAWDKLYLHSFIRENNILFPCQESVEDRFFTTIALVEAKRISILDGIPYITYRMNNPKSLDGQREKYALDVYYSLYSIKTRLIEKKIFENLEIDFINNALHSVLEYLFNRTGKAFDEAWQFLQAEGFSNLGLVGKDRECFEDKGEYDFFINEVYGKSIRDYFVSELDKKQVEIDKRQRSFVYRLDITLLKILRMLRRIIKH